jgi:hypothetical protein
LLIPRTILLDEVFNVTWALVEKMDLFKKVNGRRLFVRPNIEQRRIV